MKASKRIQPRDIPKALERALNLHQQGRLIGADKLYQAILASRPAHFDAMHLRGVLAAQLGELERSARLITQAIELSPQSAEAHFNLGITLTKLKRMEEAVQRFQQALAIEPGHAGALSGLGDALASLDRHDEALAAYDRALAVDPRLVAVLYARGGMLRKLARHAEAIESYDRALEMRPDHVRALNDRGNALQDTGRLAEAVASYDRALATDPRFAHAHYNRGNALGRLSRHDEAAASYRKTLEIDPGHPCAIGNLAHSLAHSCDWREFGAIRTRVVEEVKSGKPASLPFPFLSLSDDPAAQLACASTYARFRFPPVSPPLWSGERYQHDRIRVAYLSADFRDHALAYLMAGLFERHDRSRFEVTALSFRSEPRSAMQARLKKSFEHFIDVLRMSDFEVARLMREREIDIAVDLMGFTAEARTGIFAHRPAPVQVNYLGFPGTMGAPYIDYILADRFVIPEERRADFSGKVVWLPDCFQVNDTKRKISPRTPSRHDAGLPEQGFVFCCFNNTYKLTPEVFDSWMAILRTVPGSVLWLLEGGPGVADDLRREAAARGVEPERLAFAPRVRPEAYLARYRLADLFLDTSPYNAATTASDALWTGLPVLTRAGESFAGRMAGSLLHAVGLREFVTRTPEEYEALSVGLATDPVRLGEIREKPARSRPTAPLFDTDRFRRHLEAAYTRMWEIARRGGQPESFAIDPVAP